MPVHISWNVKFAGTTNLGDCKPTSLLAYSSFTPPPERRSTAPPRTLQCGGGSSESMSLKSSKKIVFSPGMKSIGVDFKSGWPPGVDDGGAASGAVVGGAEDSAAGAAADATGALAAAGAPPGTF